MFYSNVAEEKLTQKEYYNTKVIRVHSDVLRALAARGKFGQTFSDVIAQLLKGEKTA